MVWPSPQASLANRSVFGSLTKSCSAVRSAWNFLMLSFHAAVVGGVTLLTTDDGHRLFEQRGILAREPVFHVFDRRAGGLVPAEGAGVVVLKPLARYSPTT